MDKSKLIGINRAYSNKYGQDIQKPHINLYSDFLAKENDYSSKL